MWALGSLLLGCVLLSQYFLGIYHRADCKIYDFLCSVGDAPDQPPQAVVLDIDDATLSAVGQWPWPRYVMGALVDGLRQLRPRLMVLDILFSEKDRTSPLEIRKRYRQHFDVDLDIVGLPPGMDDNDGYLAAMLRQTPVVGAMFFLHDLYNTAQDDAPATLDVQGAERLEDIPEAAGILCNIPELRPGCSAAGFINVRKDADGILRRFSMLYRYKGKLYPHIVLAALMRLRGIERFSVVETLVGFELRGRNDRGETLTIPVGRDGAALLRFGGRKRPHLSRPAVEVLERRVADASAAAFFADKAVIIRTRQLTLESMAAIAEMRSVEGGAHIRRTQYYVQILADRLRASGRYPLLTPQYISLLFHSAPLHDLGKVAIPDAILFKPGKLTAEEFDIMKEHAVYGCRAIETAAQGLDQDHFLALAAEIALTHHERWDGTGYPRGLAREDIPLSGRIMALADVYDALLSKRVYKEGFSHEKARDIIVAERGTHFDPCVVDAFLAEEAAFRRLAETL